MEINKMKIQIGKMLLYMAAGLLILGQTVYAGLDQNTVDRLTAKKYDRYRAINGSRIDSKYGNNIKFLSNGKFIINSRRQATLLEFQKSIGEGNSVTIERIQPFMEYCVVDEIADAAFLNCVDLEEINLPSSIRFISPLAFIGCVNLKRINIPENNKYFSNGPGGELLDKSGTRLIRYMPRDGESNYTVADNIESIEAWAFDTAPEKIEEINLSSSVKTISPFAFTGCLNLKRIHVPESNEYFSNGPNGELLNKDGTRFIRYIPQDGESSYTIPDDIQSIEATAFEAAVQLKTLHIGKSLTTFEFYLFENCFALERFDVSKENQKFSSVDGILFSKFHDELIACPLQHFDLNGEINTKYTVPPEVTKIGSSAFADNSALCEVHISDGVKQIDNMAFASCDRLQIVTGGKNLEILGACAFINCAALKHFPFQDKLRSLGTEAFKNCFRLEGAVNLKNLFWGNIRKGSFENCESISYVQLSNGISKIDDSAFKGCVQLSCIDIPKVDSIGKAAFQDCVNLEIVHIEEGIESIGRSAFANCGSLREISLPNSINVIGEQCFLGCKELQTVKIGNGVERINEDTFAFCPKLKNVTLGSNVTTIEKNAFRSCVSLREITMPASIDALACHAFNECNKLSKVYFEGSKPRGFGFPKRETSWAEILVTIVCLPAFALAKRDPMDDPVNFYRVYYIFNPRVATLYFKEGAEGWKKGRDQYTNRCKVYKDRKKKMKK